MIRRVLAAVAARPRHGRDARRRRPRDGRQIKDFITAQKILRLPEPDQCRIDRDARVHAGQLGGLPEPGAAARRRGSSEYAISPPPADWSPERVASFFREYNRAMLKILTIHEAYPGHYVQLEYSNRHAPR